MQRTGQALGGRVVAAFADGPSARRAEAALLAAGFDASGIVIAGAPAADAPAPVEREERFLGRLVLIIVAWSMVGAAVGVAIGVGLNVLEIGPGGAAGVGIQIASWAIFAHMIAGMWAGYALLTKGESRQRAPSHDGRVFVSVQCADPAQHARAEAMLRDAGASAISRYDAAGQTMTETDD